MSKTVHSTNDIPRAAWYVTAKDTFLSGWGQASGKTNIVVLPCETRAEAVIVADNARARSDMRYVRITGARPKMRSGVLFSLMTKENGAEPWYREGYFSAQVREAKIREAAGL